MNWATYLYNSNGETYEIIAKYWSRTGASHYLLASHRGVEDDRAATVTQYIIAHNWDRDSRSWAQGEYYPVWMDDAQSSALAAWRQLICDEADNF